MDGYAAEVEQKMQRFFGWLSEKDRRRYAAVEAATLGPGGVESSARVFAGDPHTIRQGLHELDAAAGRMRTTGGDARRERSHRRLSKRTAAAGGRRSRLAIRGAKASCGRTGHGARGHAAWWRWERPPGGVRSDGG